MNKQSLKDIEETLVHEAAAILSCEPAAIKPNAPLHTLGIDSLSFVELLVIIEKKFNLKLMDSGLTREDFSSLHSLASCISKQR